MAKLKAVVLLQKLCVKTVTVFLPGKKNILASLHKVMRFSLKLSYPSQIFCTDHEVVFKSKVFCFALKNQIP